MVLGFGLQEFFRFLSSLATSELDFGEYGFFLQLSSFVSVFPIPRKAGELGIVLSLEQLVF